VIESIKIILAAGNIIPVILSHNKFRDREFQDLLNNQNEKTIRVCLFSTLRFMGRRGELIGIRFTVGNYNQSRNKICMRPIKLLPIILQKPIAITKLHFL
jgi:hypothetical protein